MTTIQCSLHFLCLIILLLASGSIVLSKITFTEKPFSLVTSCYNQDAEARARDWQLILEQQENQLANAQLYEINGFFNRIGFVDEKQQLPVTQRHDLISTYSFNSDGLWHAKSQGQFTRLQSKNNNNLWLDLTERMKQGYQ